MSAQGFSCVVLHCIQSWRATGMLYLRASCLLCLQDCLALLSFIDAALPESNIYRVGFSGCPEELFDPLLAVCAEN